MSEEDDREARGHEAASAAVAAAAAAAAVAAAAPVEAAASVASVPAPAAEGACPRCGKHVKSASGAYYHAKKSACSRRPASALVVIDSPPAAAAAAAADADASSAAPTAPFDTAAAAAVDAATPEWTEFPDKTEVDGFVIEASQDRPPFFFAAAAAAAAATSAGGASGELARARARVWELETTCAQQAKQIAQLQAKLKKADRAGPGAERMQAGVNKSRLRRGMVRQARLRAVNPSEVDHRHALCRVASPGPLLGRRRTTCGRLTRRLRRLRALFL